MANNYNVLVVGSGGREHALAWKLAQSPRVNRLYVAPGNEGTSEIADNVPIWWNIEELVRFAKEGSVDLTIIGQNDPLAYGVVDVFRSYGLRIFGPTRSAAKIETSKAFAKRLMDKNNIPTAPFQIFRKIEKALEYVHQGGMPVVIKTNGVIFKKKCVTAEEAEKILKQIHGSASNEIIVEKALDGTEISTHALCDGNNFILFPVTQSLHNQGVIFPLPWIAKKTIQQTKNKVITPLLSTLKQEQRPFTGCLCPRLKITKLQGLNVLEFEASFGDLETQTYMRLMKTDLLDVLEACLGGKIAEFPPIQWHPGFAVCIFLGASPKALALGSIQEAEKIPNVMIFRYKDHFIGITATGETLKQSLDAAYQAAACFP
ncbi:MAG: hypothetical protein ABIC19_03140 [Patescibacteria group bacterium]|nr:hypothetical protein [Patescibacteria group bacterium]